MNHDTTSFFRCEMLDLNGLRLEKGLAQIIASAPSSIQRLEPSIEASIKGIRMSDCLASRGPKAIDQSWGISSVTFAQILAVADLCGFPAE